MNSIDYNSTTFEWSLYSSNGESGNVNSAIKVNNGR